MCHQRRPTRHGRCVDCGAHAPRTHIARGPYMWPGPRCTACAAKRYSARTGCAPEQAERLMLAERTQSLNPS